MIYIPASSSRHSPLIFGRENSLKPGSTYRSIFSIKRKERTLLRSGVITDYIYPLFILTYSLLVFGLGSRVSLSGPREFLNSQLRIEKLKC